MPRKLTGIFLQLWPFKAFSINFGVQGFTTYLLQPHLLTLYIISAAANCYNSLVWWYNEHSFSELFGYRSLLWKLLICLPSVLSSHVQITLKRLLLRVHSFLHPTEYVWNTLFPYIIRFWHLHAANCLDNLCYFFGFYWNDYCFNGGVTRSVLIT